MVMIVNNIDTVSIFGFLCTHREYKHQLNHLKYNKGYEEEIHSWYHKSIQ